MNNKLHCLNMTSHDRDVKSKESVVLKAASWSAAMLIKNITTHNIPTLSQVYLYTY